MNRNLKTDGVVDEVDTLRAQVKRRAFIKSSTAGLAVSALVFGGCTDAGEDLITKKKADDADKSNALARANDDDTVYLGSGDIGILNYAYALEQLEAAFYTMVVAEGSFSAMYSAEEQMILNDLKKHEIVHREFLKAALADNAIRDLIPDFSAVDFSSRTSVLATAKTFEDLGVAAYNGAGKLLVDVNYLLVAGKIVSVEARHAAAIRDVINPLSADFAGDDVVDENGLDGALMPANVLAAAQPFIKDKIDGSELPTS
jgi:hypothetical protein